MKHTLVLQATKDNKHLAFYLSLDEAIPMETRMFIPHIGQITKIDNAFFCPKENELQYYLILDSDINHLSEVTEEVIQEFISRNWTVQRY